MSTSPFTLPESAKLARFEATMPGRHAWVSANAGSGKTSILRDRVMRLLLQGVPPDRILCLTYTKAAAAEMQNRIFAELAKWATKSDAELIAAIITLAGEENAGRAVSPERLARARRVFAEAVETPGGLKIQTIHAFAERMLHLFPIEAGVPFDFSVLDDTEAEAIRVEARQATLAEALAQPETPLGRAFATIAEATGMDGFAGAVALACKALSNQAGVESASDADDAAYSRLFGVDASLTEARFAERYCAEEIDLGAIESWVEALSALPYFKSSQQVIDGFKAALAAEDASAVLEALIGALLTQKHEPRAKPLVGKHVTAEPEIAEAVQALAAQLPDYLEKRRALRALHRSRALTRFAGVVLARINQAKARRGLLDFDDLITRLAALLTSAQARWVMLKLDAAIEHILVDEAQDTTPKMWQIIRALADDFFSGEGQTRFSRSIFVVGDEKQSIFSFQGARPHVFNEVREAFALDASDETRRPNPNALIASPVALRYSFRTSADVLAAVDHVFKGQRAIGLTTDAAAEITHLAAYTDKPGMVEIWPLVEKPDVPVPDDPLAPVDAPSEDHPSLIAARQVADRVATLLAGERHLAGGKPIRPGDILILCQHRNRFFNAVLRELRKRDVPVAGADRLKLGEEIAIDDLKAVAAAALQPEDDLSLAAALKSPFFGASDLMLERLSRGRAGSLRAAIRDAVAADPTLAAIDARLDHLAARARVDAPYEFFAKLLGEPVPGTISTGRQAVMQRLGRDVTDALDAFLADAMEYGLNHPPSLTSYHLASEKRPIEIKRDMDTGQGQVRVMTVHASKGLEARIVFLCDAALMPSKRQEPELFLLPTGDGELLVWAGGRKQEPEVMAAARAEQRRLKLEEHRRLLYVGMTRAADRLYVSAYRHGKKPKDDNVESAPAEPLERNWHGLIIDAFRDDAPHVLAREAGLPNGPVLVWPPLTPAHPPAEDEADAARPPVLRPLWLDQVLPPEVPPAPPIRPSMRAPTGEDEPRRAEHSPDPAMVGTVLHALFEHLSALDPAKREAAALRLVAHLLPQLAAEDRPRFAAPVLNALALPALQPFLVETSRAEVALAGQIPLADGRSAAIRGRIDRLAVTPEAVRLLDLKTGRRRRLDAESEITRQLALYRSLLTALYPDRPVLAAVLWLGEGECEELSPAMLDAAFGRIRSHPHH